MSVEAITWALRQPVPSSPAKFVLVVLANCARAEDSTAWPSIDYVADATGQDRKTVIANFARLATWGLIEDTGNRAGRTRQIVVYRLMLGEAGALAGAESHYCYRLTCPSTGEFYVGVRTCIGEPKRDAYAGSGVWPRSQALRGDVLTKEVLSMHPSRRHAEAAEADLIAAHAGDPLCMNRDGNKKPKNGTLPKGPDFPPKESRFSPERVPKTGHGTVNNPKEPSSLSPADAGEREPTEPRPPPEPPPITAAPTPTLAGGACQLMRLAGCIRVNPSHPLLLAALAEGVTPQALADTAAEAVAAGMANPFPWAVATARGRHAEGAKLIHTTGARHASDQPRESLVDRATQRAARIFAEHGFDTST